MTVKKITCAPSKVIIELERIEVGEIAEALEKFVGKDVKRYGWNQMLKAQFSILASILYDKPIATSVCLEDGSEREVTDEDRDDVIKAWFSEVKDER